MKKTKLLSLISFAFATTLLLNACSNGNNNASQSYDGRVFDISEKHDNSLTVTTTKNGYQYDLSIQGSGKSIDFTRKEEVPWNPIIKKISAVTINEGILNIGDYFFYSLPLEYFILPQTVESVGDHSFSPDSVVYTYGSHLDNVPNAYYYSETKPTDSGKYFFVQDGVPHPWRNASVLFIGNSFTFRQGSEEDPAVPRYFKAIAENVNQSVDVDFVVRSSYSLAKYSDPKDELGKVVEQKLTTNSYDYVILQEQSTTPLTNYNSFFNAVVKLKNRISETQKNCETVLYETWGSPTGIQGTSYKTVGEMELALRSAYDKAGSEADCPVDYVGKAFTYAYENYPNIQLYAEDNRHQSNLGAYLSAAVHVRSLFNLNVSNVDDFCGLNPNECKAYLSVADTIC